jgi:hypothetical protein
MPVIDHYRDCGKVVEVSKKRIIKDHIKKPLFDSTNHVLCINRSIAVPQCLMCKRQRELLWMPPLLSVPRLSDMDTKNNVFGERSVLI